MRDELGVTNIVEGAGLGIKPISAFGTKRLVRAAIRYAIERGRRSITLVHKGNIQKFTEGAFRQWGYDVAAEEFPEETISWDEGRPCEIRYQISRVNRSLDMRVDRRLISSGMRYEKASHTKLTRKR